jgi:hypothetical protein
LNLHIFPDPQQLGLAAANQIAQFSAEAIAVRRFIIAYPAFVAQNSRASPGRQRAN